jgi:hypothetical protein
MQRGQRDQPRLFELLLKGGADPIFPGPTNGTDAVDVYRTATKSSGTAEFLLNWPTARTSIVPLNLERPSWPG